MEKPFRKEVMERDALNRIKWDKRLNPEDFTIQYLDLGRLKEINFSELKLCGDFFKVKENLIPMHRIRKIRCREEVVWDRRRL